MCRLCLVRSPTFVLRHLLQIPCCRNFPRLSKVFCEVPLLRVRLPIPWFMFSHAQGDLLSIPVSVTSLGCTQSWAFISVSTEPKAANPSVRATLLARLGARMPQIMTGRCFLVLRMTRVASAYTAVKEHHWQTWWRIMQMFCTSVGMTTSRLSER